MIIVGMVVNIADNSGGKVGKCIKVLNKKRFGVIGDTIIISVIKLRSQGKVKRKEIYKGLIVRTRKPFFRNNGSYLNFDDNSVILLNKKEKPVGSRMKGPILKELRRKKMVRLISVSSAIL